MSITVVWDTWFKPGAEAEGLRLTRQVWSDMRAFEGYLSHQILVDDDAPGHIVAIAQWRSREHADQVREKYKGSEVIQQLMPLLGRPRERWVMREDDSSTVQRAAALDQRNRQSDSVGRNQPVWTR